MDYEYMKGLSDHIRVNLPATPEDEDTGKRLELISKLYRRGYMDGARDAKKQ